MFAELIVHGPMVVNIITTVLGVILFLAGRKTCRLYVGVAHNSSRFKKIGYSFLAGIRARPSFVFIVSIPYLLWVIALLVYSQVESVSIASAGYPLVILIMASPWFTIWGVVTGLKTWPYISIRHRAEQLGLEGLAPLIAVKEGSINHLEGQAAPKTLADYIAIWQKCQERRAGLQSLAQETDDEYFEAWLSCRAILYVCDFLDIEPPKDMFGRDQILF